MKTFKDFLETKNDETLETLEEMFIGFYTKRNDSFDQDFFKINKNRKANENPLLDQSGEEWKDAIILRNDGKEITYQSVMGSVEIVSITQKENKSIKLGRAETKILKELL